MIKVCAPLLLKKHPISGFYSSAVTISEEVMSVCLNLKCESQHLSLSLLYSPVHP